MNLLWSIFNKGRTADTSKAYARKTEIAGISLPVKVRQTVNSMVVDSPETARYFRIERLVQVVTNSPYASQLAELDPYNTYMFPVEVAPDIEVTNPTSLQVTPMPSGAKTDPVITYSIILDTITEQITVSTDQGADVYPLLMTDNLSAVIEMSPSLSIRLQGDVSAQINGSVIQVVDSVHPAFDLAKILESTVVPEWYDGDLRSIYIEGTPVEKTAAVMLNALEGFNNG